MPHLPPIFTFASTWLAAGGFQLAVKGYFDQKRAAQETAAAQRMISIFMHGYLEIEELKAAKAEKEKQLKKEEKLLKKKEKLLREEERATVEKKK